MDKKQEKLENLNTRNRFGLLDMLCFVIWFGVLSGLAEIILPQLNELRGGKEVFLRSHTVWMSPLANVVVVGIVGLIMLPLIVRLSRPKGIRIAFIVLASVVFLNALVLEFAILSQIHFAAKISLAIGLAVIVQRLIVWWRIDFERFVRCTMIFLVFLVVMLTVAISGHRYLKERKIIAGLPDPPESVPNVLLIVLDTVRAESMSLYGYERDTTPFLKAFAKDGIVFQNAIATSSWTFPSHVSMFTGRFRYETATNWKNLDSQYATLAEFLTGHGYVTAGFVANTMACSLETGLARGFIHYEDYAPSLKEFARSSALIRITFSEAWITPLARRLLKYYDVLHRTPAFLISKNFLSWIKRVPSDRPFFVFLNYLDAHAPYLPPEKFIEKFGPIDQYEKLRENFPKVGIIRPGDIGKLRPDDLVQKEVKAMNNAYDGTIAYLDTILKELFSELQRIGQLERTLVFVVADHGEEFAEHDTFGHGLDLHSQSIHVPFILRLPKIVPTGIIIQEPVILRDIPKTIIDLLGLSDDGLFPGFSLLRHWTNADEVEANTNEFILSELLHAPWEPKWSSVSKGDMKSLIFDNMHYIRNGDGTEEVYDLNEDSEEYDNLIQTQIGKDIAEQARGVLKQLIR